MKIELEEEHVSTIMESLAYGASHFLMAIEIHSKECTAPGECGFAQAQENILEEIARATLQMQGQLGDMELPVRVCTGTDTLGSMN